MAYRIEWLVPSKVIYAYSYGVVTAEELLAYMQSVGETMQQSSETVHLITDGTAVTENKFGVSDLKNAFPKNTPDSNLGWTLAISNSIMGRFFSTIVFQMMGVKGRGAASVPEGLAFLSEQDSSLPSLAEMTYAWEQLQAEIAVV